MQFQPLSESEVLNLLPEGEYDFLVENAEDKVSKSGNDMIKLNLAIWDNQNIKHVVFDYLLAQLMYKVKHFADATGLQDKYESGGYLASDCLNKTGRCKIVIQEDNNSSYPPKNVIKDYMKGKEDSQLKLGAKDEFIDSDLPF